MLISRECDYALRIIRNLNGETVRAVSEIVECENMTLAMGYKVSRKLETAGLIRSVRGRKGGYLLAGSPEEITVLDVYRSVEPDLLLVDCLEEGYNCPNHTKEHPCKMHRQLCRLQRQLIQDLTEIRIADVID